MLFSNNEFESNYNGIYPDENLYKFSFLGLSIEVHNKKFTTNFFDKRDAFLFHINRIPYLTSRNNLKILYASIGSEILPIARTTSNLINKLTLVIFC